MIRAIFSGFAGRLFLWFWLSLSLLLLANFLLARYLDNSTSLRPPNHQELRELKRLKHKLKRYSRQPLKKLQTGHSGRILLLYNAKTLQPLGYYHEHWRLSELVQANSIQVLHLPHGPIAIGPFTVKTASGPVLAIWKMPPRPLPLWRQLLHNSPRWRLTVSMLLVLALSLVLARWLSLPVRQISKAARQLGDGKLTVRVPVGKGELGQLAQDFNHMAAKLQESTAAQQRLLADVSHELRSPLTRLKLAAGLMEEKNSRNAYLQRIAKECETLEHLVAQVLTLSRLEGSLYQEQPEYSDLAAQVQSAVKDWTFQHPEVSIGYHGPEQLTVLTQPRLLQHVLDNLLSNACRHSQTIKLELHAQGKGWQLKVTDNGPGIDENMLAHLFEPFFRGDPARGHQGHIGLGLAIARAAAQAQEAQLSVSRLESGGLSFCLTKEGG